MTKHLRIQVRVNRPRNKGGRWTVVRVTSGAGETIKVIGSGKSYQEAMTDAERKELQAYAKRFLNHPNGEKEVKDAQGN